MVTFALARNKRPNHRHRHGGAPPGPRHCQHNPEQAPPGGASGPKTALQKQFSGNGVRRALCALCAPDAVLGKCWFLSRFWRSRRDSWFFGKRGTQGRAFGAFLLPSGTRKKKYSPPPPDSALSVLKGTQRKGGGGQKVVTATSRDVHNHTAYLIPINDI
jgi:hypothetical protein